MGIPNHVTDTFGPPMVAPVNADPTHKGDLGRRNMRVKNHTHECCLKYLN